MPPTPEYQQILNLLTRKREQIEEAILLIERLEREDNQAGSSKHPSSTARTGAKTAPAHKKRVISAAGRKRISEALKKRWAAKRAAQGGKKTAAKKGAKRNA